MKLVLVALVLVSSTASAQSDKGYESQDQVDGYKLIFVDDPLAAGGSDALGATIPVSRHGFRMTLIRPRTSFVSEMVKTVENL